MGDAPWCPARLADIVRAAKPDVIFHLVGGACGSTTALTQSNLAAAMSVMDALQTAHARPLLVCCGSAAEYGTAIKDGIPIREGADCAPVTAYGVSKHAQTNALLDFSTATGTPVLIARVFNPIGPGMPAYLALGDFAGQIACSPNGGVLQTGNIQVYRDFLDVQHVAQAMCKLVRNPDARGIVNICSGEATQLSRLVDILVALSGKTITIEPTPARMRSDELAVVIGSTALLAELGAATPRTDYAGVMARLWNDAKLRWAGSQ
jgi:GDP-4-dehydro-6-deoxy-D-mannose reductase